MDKRILVFVIRIALGLAGGYMLSWLFFSKDGKVDWVIALILAALVVAAAYVSEGWRKGKAK
jgi:hypothetical protein